MKSDSRPSSAPLLWVPLILVLLALGLRWMKLASEGMTLLPNFAPWMALAFTGTLVFPRGSLPWWAWPVMLIAIDFAAMGAQLWTLADGRAEVFLTYGLYAAAAWTANQMRGKAGILQSLLGVVTCGIVFYVVTNVLCWWVKPYYAKDLAGLVQALTTGLPGFPPTWTFLRNSLLSDLGFSAVLLVAFNAEAKVRSMPAMRWATATA
ncbi:hypothetical protein EI77_03419 [Prosthecobacter fusiformis]|uniref:Uncharacterized protein n=1 Tax=Prosthecobacter fusiformis TaxID=48464 RepID=A0A4R7RSC2_9BACT|nr:DUF6580 family putative transport protein [Prosthecobacter fusiformis]TDU67217.1 hypothetical protein EI77_03419 [Prosthecobacter fusiformis]